MVPSLQTLPIELVCRILDHLDLYDILLSVRNVCSRLNAITDIYHPYAVNAAVDSTREFLDSHFTSNLQTLTSLNLGWVYIGEEGAKRLGAALNENRVRESVPLDYAVIRA